MKIKEMKLILKQNKFDNYECNFKVKSNQPGNGVPFWFEKFIEQTFRPTISDVLNQMRAGFKQINDRIDRVEKSINSRIDNLVTKNNLKE